MTLLGIKEHEDMGSKTSALTFWHTDLAAFAWRPAEIFFGDKHKTNLSLPPAYVVRQEGNVLTRMSFHLSVHRGGGVPISHNALQHFPECHGADTGGVPCQVQSGGVPCRERGYLACQGVPCRGGTQVGHPPTRVPPPGQVRMGGGTQLGQQKE